MPAPIKKILWSNGPSSRKDLRARWIHNSIEEGIQWPPFHFYLDINDESLFNEGRTKSENGQTEGEVEKRRDGRLRTRQVFLILAVLASIGSLLPNASAEDRKVSWGFSLGGGPNADFIHSRPDLAMYTFLPRLDIPLHRKWDLEFEGNFSYYDISNDRNFYFLGLDGNILFTPIRWDWGSLFALLGGGLGYNSDGRKKVVGLRTPLIGDSHFAGIIQGGIGITYNIGKGLALRGEYRLVHISEPNVGDVGINTHTFLIGIAF